MSDEFCSFRPIWKGRRWSLSYNLWWHGFAIGVAWRNYGGGTRQVSVDLGPFALMLDRR